MFSHQSFSLLSNINTLPVMRHNDAGNLVQPRQVILQPLDVENIQVVCRLIQQHNVSAHQHGPSCSVEH